MSLVQTNVFENFEQCRGTIKSEWTSFALEINAEKLDVEQRVEDFVELQTAALRNREYNKKLVYCRNIMLT